VKTVHTILKSRIHASLRWGLTVLLCLLIPNGTASAQHSLQYRIDKANEGDTLVVPNGMYEGNLVLQKRVTLIGSAGAVLRGSGSNSIVTIMADSCILKGFTIEHSGPMLMNEDAGILVKSNGNVIEQNELRDVLFGIYLLRAHGNTISSNTIAGRRELEVGERGSGIHLYDSYHNRLVSNIVSYTRDGFYIQNAHHTWIEGNEVSNLRYGLHYMYADSNTFLGNRFHDNVAGAAIMYSTGIVMRKNWFVHNRGFASYGILFQDCHGMTADSNIVADNAVGMFFEASTNNRFMHNIIARNDIALTMFANSGANLFFENNFIDNLSPLTIVGKGTGSRWNDGRRGNYWSGYEGYDLDQDGIGDVPMKIQNVFDYLEGHRPNLRLYLYSPASQALAAATKAFPIIDVNHEIDDRPLIRPVDLNAITEPRLRAPQARPETLPFKAEIIGFSLFGMLILTAAILHLMKRTRS
jgi:nitrous oxidase accessory protein